MVNPETVLERFFEILINGDRPAARQLLAEQLQAGVPARRLVSELLWPAHELIDRMHRGDHLSAVSYHLATRLLRVLVDQTFSRLELAPHNGRTIFAACGTTDGEELAAQIAVDLLECAGFRVIFGGGGLPTDEIRMQVHERQPEVLLLFASSPTDLPGIRELIDTINEIGASRKVRIAVGGGVFNRAEGLAEEIGAHIWASSPMEMVEVLLTGEVYQEARTPQTTARPAAKTASRKAKIRDAA